jgi:hypothetical protein
MTSSDDHKQRNREIAKNEANRQAPRNKAIEVWHVDRRVGLVEPEE